MLAVALALTGIFAGAMATEAKVHDTRPVAMQASPSTLPDGWQQGAFMEIFVRAYKDTNGDGIGDLKGVTQSLDYLQTLGVKGIWLMPITASADGDHGYATTDFTAIEPAYGTLADFDELIAQAHARGMGVIMDYVINHSARSHPFFESALQGPSSPYYDWYVWESEAPKGWDIWGKNPWFTTPQGAYFGTFGPHMPDFNFRNPAVLAYHQSSLRFWLNRGLDGYRLDAVPHLVENTAKHWNDQPQSRQITGALTALITDYPKRFVVCEATAKPQVYAAKDICGSAFAFGLERQFVLAAQGERKAIHAVADYFKTAPATMATFVSNHDIFAGRRLWDQVQGNEAHYRLAAASYLLQPGTPFIYYGEELGMAGVPGLEGDLPLRTPMSWSADAQRAGFTTGSPFRPVSPNVAQNNAEAQRQDPKSLFNFYRGLLEVRNTFPSIARGSYLAPRVQGQVLAFQRTWADETTLVVINYGAKHAAVKLQQLPSRVRLKQVFSSLGEPNVAIQPLTAAVRVDGKGRATLRVAPQSVLVFAVQR